MIQKLKSLFNSSFGKDVIITTIGQVGVLIVSFLLNKFISNYLGREVFEIYGITTKSASVIACIALLGLGIALPRFIPIYQAKNDEVGKARTYLASMIMMILTTVIIFAVFFIFEDFFAKLIYGNKEYRYLILPLLLFSTYVAFTTFLYAFYRALNKFYFFNISQFIVQAIMLVIALISKSNLVLLIYLIGTIISVLSLLVLAFYASKFAKTAKIKSCKSDLGPHLKELSGFCLPRIPGELFLFAFAAIPLIIISQRGTMTTGFVVSFTINNTVTVMFGFAGMVLLPYVSKGVTTGNFKDVENKVKNISLLYLVFGVIAIIGIVLFTPLVIRILFSSEYVQDAAIVRIMVLAILPNSLYQLLRSPIDAVSKFPFNTINLGISFGVLIGIIFLVNTIQMYAVAFIIAYSILGLLSYISWIYCKKKARKMGELNDIRI